MSIYVIEVPDSHLRPGLWFELPADTDDFLVQFGADAESRAQLLRDDTGRPVLRMGGYMTATGAVVDEAVWTVSETVRDGDRVRLRIGHAL
ncbi:hypothetical protein [Nonomuraea sp. NPDC049695]|uniref:hypothetical protein n=1 Tax=Nonomuraea sp. NPDC049695 TaxID=3154734 RepID=UPI003425A0AA